MVLLNWQRYSDLEYQLAEKQKDWLFDQGSLTKRLTLLSQNNFSLNVLSEQKQRLRGDEYACVNLQSSTQQWVREVVLKGYDQPWVYARSVILPNHNEQCNQQDLTHIGQQPLGSFLFKNNHFERSPIEVTLYPTELLSFKYVSAQSLWARRSIFTGSAQIILVQEVFLLDIVSC